jgi:hypothetical protein
LSPQGQRDSLGAGEHSDKPLRWPLVNQLQARNPNLPLQKDARLINCFAEFDSEDKEYWIYKRLGLSTTPIYTAGAPATGLGTYTETGSGTVYSVFGNQLFYGSAFIGNVNSNGPYSWETLGPAGQASRQVALQNGSAAYTIRFSAGPFVTPFMVQITDPNFPSSTSVPGWCFIDGTLYVMDTSGNIWGAMTVNSANTWSALNVIEASSNADLGVALGKQLNYLIALKQYSTQVFYDAGNAPPGSPLAPVQDAQIPLGCLHGNSVQSIDNSMLWLTSNQTISPQVVQMDNLVPTIVSTPAVERLLDNIDWTNVQLGVRSWVLKHGGHRFYFLTIIQLNLTLVYDLDQKLWYVWTDSQGNYWPIVASSFIPPLIGGAGGIHLAQHISNGNLYQMDGDYEFPNDYGNLFPVDIYTPNLDFGTVRRKMLNGMYFRADRTPNSFLQARYSDDDYSSWSNFRTIDLSKNKPRMMSCGTFVQRRAYHFRHLCNTSFRIKTIDLAMEVGTI